MAEKGTIKRAVEQTTQPNYYDIPVKARVYFDTFESEDGKATEYLKVALVKPFSDEPDFDDVSIKPKWSRDEAVFKFKAKKALKECPDFTIPGRITAITYVSKNNNEEVTYAGIMLQSMIRDGEMEFSVKGESNGAVFAYLVGQKWGTIMEPSFVPDFEGSKNESNS